jgi:hypothetical protein
VLAELLFEVFEVDTTESALLTRMRELASADLFSDPTAAAVAEATAKVGAAERKLKVAVERFEADPENTTWQSKVDQYDRERRAAVKKLADVRAEAANPLPARWEEAVQLMADTEPARLRQALAGIIEDVRVLIVKRLQTRYCAAQVYFVGGAARSYLIRWTRSISLPRCKRPEQQTVWTFAEVGIPVGRDLRNVSDVAALEKLLLKKPAKPTATS